MHFNTYTTHQPLVRARSGNPRGLVVSSLAEDGDRPRSIDAAPRRPVVLVGLLTLGRLGLYATGCQSFNSPTPNSQASVTLTNRSVADIRQAAMTVFVDHGFTGSSPSPYQFIFEHPGSRMNNLAYASFMFNETVTVRVQVDLKPLDASTTVVSCNAWLVEDAGDPTFEDDHRVRKLRKWPYEELLKDIREQLKE
jgi:hypothetical protein